MKRINLKRGVSLLPIASILMLSACSATLDKLENIGQPPPHAKVEDPTTKPDYEKLTWPMPETPPPPKQYANSLWQPGSRAFFRDQRAARVGDILRVNINIKDKAQLNNQTEGKRDSLDKATAPELLGFQSRLAKIVPFGGHPDVGSLLNTTGNVDNKGTGTIKRDETIITQVAAMITQVLPNGNFVIDGKQEMTVNFEMREVSIKGVIRPEDIRSDNSVDSTQIAEARITYGGKGQLTDVQQARWGSQAIDAISPF